MGHLHQIATILTDLADGITDRMLELLNAKPSEPQAVLLWLGEIRGLSGKAKELRDRSNQLLVLDADQRLDAISGELASIAQATDQAAEVIADIERINDHLDFVAKLVTIAGGIVLLATAPTAAGAIELLKTIRATTRSAKKLTGASGAIRSSSAPSPRSAIVVP